MSKGKYAAPKEKLSPRQIIWLAAIFTGLGSVAWIMNRDPNYPAIDCYVIAGVMTFVSAFVYSILAVTVIKLAHKIALSDWAYAYDDYRKGNRK